MTNMPITEAIYGAKDRPAKQGKPKPVEAGFQIHRQIPDDTMRRLSRHYPRLRKYLG